MLQIWCVCVCVYSYYSIFYSFFYCVISCNILSLLLLLVFHNIFHWWKCFDYWNNQSEDFFHLNWVFGQLLIYDQVFTPDHNSCYKQWRHRYVFIQSCCFYTEHATGAVQVNPETYLHFPRRSTFTDVVLYPSAVAFRGFQHHKHEWCNK